MSYVGEKFNTDLEVVLLIMYVLTNQLNGKLLQRDATERIDLSVKSRFNKDFPDYFINLFTYLQKGEFWNYDTNVSLDVPICWTLDKQVNYVKEFHYEVFEFRVYLMCYAIMEFGDFVWQDLVTSWSDGSVIKDFLVLRIKDAEENNEEQPYYYIAEPKKQGMKLVQLCRTPPSILLKR